MKKKKSGEMHLTVRSPNVFISQKDRRRLKCRVCRESERMGKTEMPPRSQPLAQFRWVQAYNVQVEAFLDAHAHKEVTT
jgi:hypothetical protein